MLRELHRAGIEVVLDVLFNHTAEGNELGPLYSFRGLDNAICYLLEDRANERPARFGQCCAAMARSPPETIRFLTLDELGRVFARASAPRAKAA